MKSNKIWFSIGIVFSLGSIAQQSSVPREDWLTKLSTFTNKLGTSIKKTFTRPVSHELSSSIEQHEVTGHVFNIAAVETKEKEFLSKRLPIVKQALEKFLGISLEGKYIPKIACITSGGGYRAMLGTLGSFKAAQKMNLLDATTYMSSLSGSAWAIACWINSGLPLNQFYENLISKLERHPLKVNFNELKLILKSLRAKKAMNQPLTLVDWYGALLANILLSDFGDNRHNIVLSDQRKYVNDGLHPLPIYAAIAAETTKRDEWYEFTPYFVGAPWLGHYVPTDDFGKYFERGMTVDKAPEQSLGYMLGIFGAAFAARANQCYDHMHEALPHFIIHNRLTKKFKSLLDLHFPHKRPTLAKVHNFTYGLQTSSMAKNKTLKFADAGTLPGFNLPYPPVSGQYGVRKPDILLFLDYSGKIKNGHNLRLAEAYALRNGALFPKINYDDIDKKVISVFKDETNPDVPVVVYMPRIHPKNIESQNKHLEHLFNTIKDFDIEKETKTGYCKTESVVYTKDQSRRMAALAEYNMLASAPAIAETIRWVIDMKSR